MTRDDFPAFFEAIHGYRPFPWQAELARRVTGDPGWPSTLDLPTAAGKTAALDVAVFALALEADRPAGLPRVAATRTFFVIDRRIVVDEAAIRARRIAAHLRRSLTDTSTPPILQAAALNLVKLSGRAAGEVVPGTPGPLAVAVLRGGIYRDESWAGDPAQPTLVLSTVDQVGSRLLFRGYGLGRSGRVIHAALTGTDSLILLDEAHLSRPFLETLDSIRHHRRPGGVARGPGLPELPFRSVTMSATPGSSRDSLALSARDREDSTLARRLRASKRAELIEVPTARDQERENRRAFADRIAAGARELAAAAAKPAGEFLWPEPASAPVVGVVVNRVDTARRVFERLRDPGPGEIEAEVILLTGRIRPIDRDRILGRWLGRMRAGRDRDRPGDRPLFVVATQTIEVGADLDFDALVSEAAPLDSLRQRFGRLDRFGRLESTRAILFARKDSVAAGADDPVYGQATAETWAWLRGHAEPPKKPRRTGIMGVVDFGVDALSAILSEDSGRDLAELNSPRPRAPALLPAHLDAWVQTDPFPDPDPDVAPFLHGPERTADIQVIWRSDLPEADLAATPGPPPVEDHVQSLADRCARILELVPPSSLEAMPVPLPAARAWLEAGGDGVPEAARDVADVEGQPTPGRPIATRDGWVALRWRGPEDCAIVRADQLRPGDTIVVPGRYGGTDGFGWHPGSRVPVEDLGDIASAIGRGRPTLRIHPRAIDSWNAGDGPDGDARTLARAVEARLGRLDDEDEFAAPLEAVRGLILGWPGLPGWVRAAYAAVDRGCWTTAYPETEPPGRFALIARELVRPDGDDEPAQEGPVDDSRRSIEAGPVRLVDHSAGVAAEATRMARAIALPGPMVGDLAVAGGLHDAGKADPRFQLLLHGGDEIALAMADAPLAKSTRPREVRGRDRSGYPRGGRHEALSVALARSQPAVLAGADDRDLVLHLIGVHHGRGRPFWPVVADPENPTVSWAWEGVVLCCEARHGLERLDGGWTDRFWRLVRRHGPWGLALLEAILMLADHRRSRDEEEGRA
jgi:CRISPR-associated endonuclease/helicase Cas3